MEFRGLLIFITLVSKGGLEYLTSLTMDQALAYCSVKCWKRYVESWHNSGGQNIAETSVELFVHEINSMLHIWANFSKLFKQDYWFYFFGEKSLKEKEFGVSSRHINKAVASETRKSCMLIFNRILKISSVESKAKLLLGLTGTDKRKGKPLYREIFKLTQIRFELRKKRSNLLNFIWAWNGLSCI